MVMMQMNQNAAMMDEHRRATGAPSQQQQLPTSQAHDGGPAVPQGVGPTPSTTPDIVGREFVRQYYTMMAESPQIVRKFYSNESVYVFNGEEPLVGPQLVGQRIDSLNITNCHTKIRAVDAHETFAKAVLVQVIGEISFNNTPHRRFAQSFVLAPKSERNYYVYNDIFRYLDNVYDENTIVHDTDAVNMQDGTKNLTVNGLMHDDEMSNNQHMVNIHSYVNLNQTQSLPPRSIGANISLPQNRLVYPEPLPPSVPAPTPVSVPGAVPSDESALPRTAGEWHPQPVASFTAAAPKPPPPTSVDSKPLTVTTTGQKPSLTDPRPSATATMTGSSKPPVEPHLQSAVKDSDDRSPMLSDETAAPTTGGGGPLVSSNMGDNGVAPSWANKVAGRPPSKHQQPSSVQSSSSSNFPTPVANVMPPSATTDVSRESPSSSTAAAVPPTSAPPSFVNGGGGSAMGGRPPYFGGHRGGSAVGGKPFNKELLARQIYVKYLPEDVFDKELFDTFSTFGSVSAGGVQISRGKGRTAAFAFVTFDEASSAVKAVERHGLSIRNGSVRIQVDHRREDYSSGRRQSSDRSLDRMGGVGGPPRGGGGGGIGRGRGAPGGFRGRGGSGGGGGASGVGGRTFMPRGGPTFYSGGGGGYYPAPHDQQSPSTPPIVQPHGSAPPSHQQKQ